MYCCSCLVYILVVVLCVLLSSYVYLLYCVCIAVFFCTLDAGRGTAVAQWLRCYATIRKVAGSIPAGVSGFFIDIKSF